jgi:hypothetical protein
MLAPPWIPIPPPGYGGIEFVVALLCDALVEHGHDVELFGAPESTSAAKVHPLLESPQQSTSSARCSRPITFALAFAAIDSAAQSRRPFDVLHDHCGYTTLTMADRQPAPVVHTRQPHGTGSARGFRDRSRRNAFAAASSSARGG